MTAGRSKPKRIEASFAAKAGRVRVHDAKNSCAPPIEERARKKVSSRAETRAGAKAQVALEKLSARLKSCPFAIGHSSLRAPGPGVAKGGTAGFVSAGCD